MTDGQRSGAVQRTEAVTPARRKARFPLQVALQFILAVALVIVDVTRALDPGRTEPLAWLAAIVFTIVGIAARYGTPWPSIVPLSIPLLAIGASALIGQRGLVTLVAILVAWGNLDRADTRTRRLSAVSSAVIAAWVAGEVTFLTARWLDADAMGSAQVVTAIAVLAGGAAMGTVWEGLRGLSRWIDRRNVSHAVRSQNSTFWVGNIAVSALAVLVAVMWTIYVPLALLVVLPVLAMWRTVEAAYSSGSSSEDPTTGLATSKIVRVALADEILRAEQFDRPVGVLLVEVDGMAAITQQIGADAAEALIRMISIRLRRVARDYDVVGRLGPSTFALVLPEANASGSSGAADRARLAVSDEPFRIPNAATIKTTVSVGVAVYPEDAVDHEELLCEAELAASYAHFQGGNRISRTGSLPKGFQDNGRSAPLDDDLDQVNTSATHRVTTDGRERMVRAAGEPFGGAATGPDRLLAWAAALAGIVSAILLVRDPAMPMLVTVLMFAALAIGAEWASESIYGRANSSWAAVPLIAVAVSGQPALAPLLVALAAGVGGGLLRGVRVRQMAFNTAVLVLATMVTHLLITDISVGISGALGGLVVAAMLGSIAGAVFFVVNTWMVAAAVAVSDKVSAFDIWREELLWLIPHQIGMGLLAGLAAYALETLGHVFVVFSVIPALGLHQAQKRFIARTRDQVMRLRHLNDDLKHANNRIVRVNDRLSDALDQVNHGYLVTVESLAAAVDAKDSYTGSHIDRVEAYARLMVDVLDPDLADDDALLWGFRLHDVGKIGVPDAVLRKPGALDDDEWEIMKKHPEIGAQIVSAAPFLQGARDVILHHHERWDGRGYPYALRETAIPFTARLFTVVDAYDAMNSDRPYRLALGIDRSIEELVRNAGTQFDPEMVEAFLQIDPEGLERVRLRVNHERRGKSGGLLINMGEDVHTQLLPR